MTPVEFNRRKVNKLKLLSFGFEAIDRGYVYQTDFADGQMRPTVRLDSDDVLYTEVTDRSSGEEYVLHRVAGAAGPFVGQIRNDYEAVLKKISAKFYLKCGFEIGGLNTHVYRGTSQENKKDIFFYIDAE